MITRSTFLKTLLAAPAAAFALTKAAAKPVPPFVDHQPPTLPNRSYLVKGLAIKVPSNRIAYYQQHRVTPDGYVPEYRYKGHWDGTFKLEAGCSNPAYVLADLYERTGELPDWVVRRAGYRDGGVGQPQLNWQMLYHWGQHCDELDANPRCLESPSGAISTYWGMGHGPRFTVNAFCQTFEGMVRLRETLRMHCLSWQSTDPRYRTSWPGIPYPEGGA